jgi:hypothetical protein
MKRLLLKGIPGKLLQNAQLNRIPLRDNNANGSMVEPTCFKTAGISTISTSCAFCSFGVDYPLKML